MPETNNPVGDALKEANRGAEEQAQAATQVAMTEEQMRAVYVGEPAPLVGFIHIVDYDPQWPRLFQRDAERIQAALGSLANMPECCGFGSLCLALERKNR